MMTGGVPLGSLIIYYIYLHHHRCHCPPQMMTGGVPLGHLIIYYIYLHHHHCHCPPQTMMGGVPLGRLIIYYILTPSSLSLSSSDDGGSSPGVPHYILYTYTIITVTVLLRR